MPFIIRVRNENDKFHYLVVVQYIEADDKFGILDGERDEIVFVEGGRIRLRSTGFVITSKANWLDLFAIGWLAILLTAGACTYLRVR